MTTNIWDEFDPSLPYGVDLQEIWVEETEEERKDRESYEFEIKYAKVF